MVQLNDVPPKGGVQLPSNSSLYGRSPFPGTVYYNQFTCPNNSVSLDECTPQFAGGHCYTGELDFVIQCNLGMFVVHNIQPYLLQYYYNV